MCVGAQNGRHGHALIDQTVGSAISLYPLSTVLVVGLDINGPTCVFNSDRTNHGVKLAISDKIKDSLR